MDKATRHGQDDTDPAIERRPRARELGAIIQYIIYATKVPGPYRTRWGAVRGIRDMSAKPDLD